MPSLPPCVHSGDKCRFLGHDLRLAPFVDEGGYADRLGHHNNHGERKQILQIYCVLKLRVCNPDALGVGAADVVNMGFTQMKRWSTGHFKTSNWEECARVTCVE